MSSKHRAGLFLSACIMLSAWWPAAGCSGGGGEGDADGAQDLASDDRVDSADAPDGQDQGADEIVEEPVECDG